MICSKCNNDNAPIKKRCEHCGSILAGWCFNNVTGEYGYRTEDGRFKVERQSDEE